MIAAWLYLLSDSGDHLPPSKGNKEEHWVLATADSSKVWDSRGRLWSFGRNDWNQSNPFGPTDSDWTDVSTPILTGISHISGFQYAFLFLRTDGTVGGWGWNSNYEIDPAADSSIYIDATDSVLLEDVAQVCCGNTHCAALHRNGDVVAWGDNDYGQCNPGDLTHPWLDRSTVIISNAVQICVGEHFTAALLSSGDVTVWGRNAYGQVDPANHGVVDMGGPNVVVSGMKQISCGDLYIIALGEDGNVYGWGRNARSQVDPINASAEHLTPEIPVHTSGRAVLVAAGYRCTFVVEDGGDLIGWGYNDYRQVDIDKDYAGIDGKKTYEKGIVGVSVHYHTLCVDVDGNVYGWGRNSYHESEPTSETSPTLDTEDVILSIDLYHKDSRIFCFPSSVSPDFILQYLFGGISISYELSRFLTNFLFPNAKDFLSRFPFPAQTDILATGSISDCVVGFFSALNGLSERDFNKISSLFKNKIWREEAASWVTRSCLSTNLRDTLLSRNDLSEKEFIFASILFKTLLGGYSTKKEVALTEISEDIKRYLLSKISLKDVGGLDFLFLAGIDSGREASLLEAGEISTSRHGDLFLKNIISSNPLYSVVLALNELLEKDFVTKNALALNVFESETLTSGNSYWDIDLLASKKVLNTNYDIFVDGKSIKNATKSLKINFSRGDIPNTFDAVVKGDRADFSFRKTVIVVIINNVDEYDFLVEDIQYTEDLDLVSIWGRTLSCLDDEEYNDNMNFSVGANGWGLTKEQLQERGYAEAFDRKPCMAKEAIEFLLSNSAVVFDESIPDWILPETFSHSGSPIDIAARIAEAGKFVIRSNFSNVVSVEPFFPERPIDFKDKTPDIYIDRGVVTALPVNLNRVQKINAVDITGYMEDTQLPDLEVENSSPLMGEVVYLRTYWPDGKLPKRFNEETGEYGVLLMEPDQTSGKIKYLGYETELFEEDIDFTDYSGSVSKPVVSVQRVEWIGRPGGIVNFSPGSKSFFCEERFATGKIFYTTGFQRWMLYSHFIERIVAAFILGNDSNVFLRVRVDNNEDLALGKPVEDSLITDRVIAAVRGKAEIDSQRYNTYDITADTIYINGIKDGMTVQVADEIRNIYGRGIVVGGTIDCSKNGVKLSVDMRLVLVDENDYVETG